MNSVVNQVLVWLLVRPSFFVVYLRSDVSIWVQNHGIHLVSNEGIWTRDLSILICSVERSTTFNWFSKGSVLLIYCSNWNDLKLNYNFTFDHETFAVKGQICYACIYHDRAIGLCSELLVRLYYYIHLGFNKSFPFQVGIKPGSFRSWVVYYIPRPEC